MIVIVMQPEVFPEFCSMQISAFTGHHIRSELLASGDLGFVCV